MLICSCPYFTTNGWKGIRKDNDEDIKELDCQDFVYSSVTWNGQFSFPACSTKINGEMVGGCLPNLSFVESETLFS